MSNKDTGVWLVAGLGYGDETKGSVTDWLVRRTGATTVVRYNGGAQAGHRVVLPDGREHIFSQFGSGTFVPGVRTHLSRFMLVEPIGMLREEEHLQSLGCADAFRRTTIDETAPVITPFHIAANRILELARGVARHGSCGLGIGETVEDLREAGADALCARDLASAAVLQKKLAGVRDRKLAKIRRVLGGIPEGNDFSCWREILDDNDVAGWYAWCLERYAEFARHAHIVGGRRLRELLAEGGVVFEGAQGMLLDPAHGFQPHVTKTDITFANANTLLQEAGYDGPRTRVGVIRGYMTRHGNGPLITEDESLSAAIPDARNEENDWQGVFRVGHFDAVAARYALEAIGGADELAVTCLDRLFGLPEVKVCTKYLAADRDETLGDSRRRIIGRMQVSAKPDEAQREELTRALALVQPFYGCIGPVRNRVQAYDYAETLGALLGCAPSLLSFGPAAEDKISIKP